MAKLNKKSQGISINTIIIAAIALAVLVVLFMIFTGRFKIFSEGVSSTASCENACKAIGKKFVMPEIKSTCLNKEGATYMPGEYSDVPGSGKEGSNVCCCTPA